jgi:hypothetical protein
LDLLTTCTHHSELQVITAPPLIATLYKSPQYPPNRSLAKASDNGDSSSSRAQVLPSPTPVHNCLPAIPSTELNLHLVSASLRELSRTQHFSSQLNCQLSIPQLLNCLLKRISQLFSARLGSSLYSLGADPTENTVS